AGDLSTAAGGRFAVAIALARGAESVVEGTPSRGMALRQAYPSLEALRKLEASLKEHFCPQNAPAQAATDTARASRSPSRPTCGKIRILLRAWCPRLRKVALVSGTLGGAVMLALLALLWRLSTGPIELDIATPWPTAAIKEKFGARHQVEIGGTQPERDPKKGRTSLPTRHIAARAADGPIAASAPKAEVGISGASLFLGRIRAGRLSLVGAEMAVRIEQDSKITVFAGSNKRPLVTASAGSALAPAQPIPSPTKSDRPAAAGPAEPR